MTNKFKILLHQSSIAECITIDGEVCKHKVNNKTITFFKVRDGKSEFSYTDGNEEIIFQGNSVMLNGGVMITLYTALIFSKKPPEYIICYLSDTVKERAWVADFTTDDLKQAIDYSSAYDGFIYKLMD